MTILLAITISVLANELTALSPWLARRLVRWSARAKYTDLGRAAMRAEELQAVIEDCPGKTFKLLLALSFAGDAVLKHLRLTTTLHPRTLILNRITLPADVAHLVAGHLIEVMALRMATGDTLSIHEGDLASHVGMCTDCRKQLRRRHSITVLIYGRALTASQATWTFDMSGPRTIWRSRHLRPPGTARPKDAI